MAKNEFTVTLKIDDKGNLKQVGQKADKASKGVGKMTKETHSADRAMKGLSQQSSSGTKNFSKMAQGLSGGLVPAYATLAANIFAVTAAFRFLSDAANYRILIEGQQEWARVTGESLRLVTDRLQEATGQQLAFAEAAQSTAIARAAGVSTDQIERLGKVARNASIALGRDLTDSVNRLIRGTTKAEPELLDELGIILRLETASKNYAAQIGKTVKELTIFEKTQAVTNEVLRQGEEKFGNFETELNSFSKMAKAFDDLLNRIKGSLTGVAEFMAGAMSKNVLALAGGFTILGSSILRSLTPDVPQVDLAAGAGKATGDVGKFYKGKKAIGAGGQVNVKELERSMKARKSSVLDFETFSRREAEKTLSILKANNARLEADKKGTFARIKGNWLATLYTMEAEHGKWIGRMKFAQRGLMKALSWAGWIGLAFTAFGIVKQLIYDWTTDDATKKFHEEQGKLVEKFEKQAETLSRLNATMVQHKNILAEINQLGKFFGNISYSGLTSGFGDIERVSTSDLKDLKAGGDTSTRSKIKNWFTKDMDFSVGDSRKMMEEGALQAKGVVHFDEAQRGIVKNIVTQLEAEQSKLRVGSKNELVITGYIKNLTAALNADDIKNPEKIKKILTDLATEGSPAAKELSSLGNAIQGTNDAILTHTNAMGSLTIANTEFSKMTGTYRDLGKAYTDISEKLEDVAEGVIKAKEIFTDTNKEWFKTMLGEGVFAGIMKDEEGNERSAEEKIKKLGEALTAEATRLHDKEVMYLTQKIQLETERLTVTRGMPKLLAAQVNKNFKVLSISQEIARIEDYKLTLIDKGVKQNTIAIKQEEEKVNKLKAQLAIAEDEASLLTEMKTNMMEAFSSSLMTAIDGLIQGTVTVKEAFASMAKAVLQALAQILAKMAALAILNVMFPGMGAIPLAAGGVIPGRGKRPRGYRSGGIVTDPTYLVGEGKYNEAVVPLPDGRSIPVQMQGGGSNVVVNVNVASDGQTTSSLTQNDGQQAAQLGRAISVAVQEELHKQARPGGMLSPYGP